jgi:hypothetical protein
MTMTERHLQEFPGDVMLSHAMLAELLIEEDADVRENQPHGDGQPDLSDAGQFL